MVKKSSQNHLNIKDVGINAPISFKKVGPDGNMPMPNSPDDVVCYDFSAFPGLGGKVGEYGNAIFSGHVDSGFDYCDYGKIPPPCMAVLWNLDKLTKGNEINVFFDNKKFVYKIISNRIIIPQGKAWNNVLKSTRNEIITVFTCAGEFNSEKYSYNKRQVVRAKRVL